MKGRGLVGLAVALAAHAPALAAAPLAGAKAMVDGIYRALPGAHFDFRSARYNQELRRWMDRDAAASKGEVGALDGIPFCDCQDTDPNYRFETRIVRTATGATALVRLRNGAWSLVKVDLVRARQGWLIADIHTQNTPSLLAYLRREVPREEKGGR